MEEKVLSLPHTLYIDNGNKISFTGITDVGSFNEELLTVETCTGSVQLTGENLQVTKLSLESGEVTVEGRVRSVQYADKAVQTGGFFAKVFK